MPDVDEKVVRLTLDSKDFDKDTEKTIKSLDELKESLKFEGIGKGFDEITDGARRVNLSPIQEGVQAVSNQFNLLTTIADTAFRNLTNKAIDAGERMIKSLSVDQITTGWGKYAEQTGAVQTIMAATANQFEDTATQMEEVNAQLEKLTWFTDETSHKFNDMVSGIGKFTANNIDLDTSVKAMEGIAVWASLSGANTNEASRAIYNLAQAISVGSVKLIDWRSIENANMGTTEFKQTVIETAEEVGVLTKVTDGLWRTMSGKEVSISNFSENLSAGWFNSDVLLKSLDKYGNFADRLNQLADESGALTTTLINYVEEFKEGTLDMHEAMKVTKMSAEDLAPWLEELSSQENELGLRAFKAAQETKTFQEAIDYVKEAVSSGWSTSFKYIFGDYLEAKEWWSEIAESMYDVFVIGGEIRNSILDIWKDDGGRDNFLDGIRALIENVKKILDLFSDTWNETFYGENDKNNSQLTNRAKALLKLTDAFKKFADAIKPTENTAKNIKDILKTLFSILKTGIDIIKALGKALSPLGAALNVISGALLQIVADIARVAKSGLETVFTPERINKIANALTILSRIVSGTLQIGMYAIFSIVEKLIDSVENLFKTIQDNGGGIRGIIETARQAITAFWDAFMEGTSFANRFVDTVLMIFGGIITGVQFIIETVIALLNGELDTKELLSGDNALADGIRGFKSLLDKLDIPTVLSNITDWIKAFVSELTAVDGPLTQFVNDLSETIEYLGSVLKRLLDTLTIDDIKSLLLIAILWQFVSSINAVNKSASGFLGNVGGTFKLINEFFKGAVEGYTILDKFTNMFNKTMFLQIGIAISLIVSAIGTLNRLDWDKTQRSVAALLSVAAIFVATFAALKKIGDGQAKKLGKEVLNGVSVLIDSFGRNILKISTGVFLVVQAIKTLNEVLFDKDGKFDLGKMLVSIGGVIAIISALSGAVLIMDNVKTKGVSVASIIGIAIGMMLVVNAVKGLATINDIWVLATAVTGVSSMMIAMGTAVRIMSSIKWSTALSLVPLVISFSASIAILTTNVMGLTFLLRSGDKVWSALGVMVGELGALAIAISVMGQMLKKVKASTIVAIGFAMVEMAGALAAMGGALKIIERYDIKGAAGGLIALGLSFAAIAGALTFMSQAMIEAKPSQILSIGLSLIEFASAITIIVFAIKQLEGIGFEKIGEGLIVLGGLLGLFTALSAFATTVPFLANTMNTIGDAFLKFGVALLAVSAAIAILQTAFTAFATMIIAAQAFADKLGIDLPAIISAGFDTIELVIREFLEMLRNLIPDIAITAAALITAFALGMIAAKHATAAATVAVILAIAETIVNRGPDIVDALVQLINFVNASTELFEALTSLAATLGAFLASAFVMAVCGALGGVAESLADCVEYWTTGSFTDGNRRAIAAAAPEVAKDYSGLFEKAIDNMNSGEVDAKIKKNSKMIINKTLNEFAKGQTELDEQAAWSAIKSMAEYEKAATGEISETTKALAIQIAEGVDGISDETREKFKELGQGHIDAYAEGTDPVIPFDQLTALIKNYAGPGIVDSVLAISDETNTAWGDLGSENISAYYEALADGMSDFINNVALFTGFGNNDKKKFKTSDFADIDSPDDVMSGYSKADAEREKQKKEANDYGWDLGSNLADGLGSALGSSKAGAAGAKTQAEKIKDAFQEAFDEWDIDKTTDDLLYKLWQARNPNATDAEKTAAEIGYTQKKLAYALKELETYEQIYKQTVDEYGEDSKEAVQAMHEFYQAQIDVLDLQNKITELQDQTAQSSTENASAFLKFSESVSESYEALKKHGFSDEQIRNALANEAGWKQPLLNMANNLAEEGKAAAESSANAVIGTYASTILNNTEYMTTYLSEAGNATISSLGDGMKNAAGEVINAVDHVAEKARLQFDTHKPEWLDIGKQEAIGNAEGIEQNADKPINAAKEMTQGTIDMAKEVAEVNSPSKQFVYIGEMMAEGLKVGILSKAEEIARAAAEVVLKAIAAAKAAADIHSPSGEGIYIGEMFDVGIITGLNNYSHKVSSSAAQLVENAVEEAVEESNLSDLDKYISNYMSGNDLTLVLDVDTSVLDEKLSEYALLQKELYSIHSRNAEAKKSGMWAMAFQGFSAQTKDGQQVTAYTENQMQMQKKFYEMVSKSTQGTYNQMSQISGEINAIKKQLEFAEFLKSLENRYDMAGMTVNFTQNNTSPEPLTRVDIYRDTKQQLERFSKAMEKNQIRGRR